MVVLPSVAVKHSTTGAVASSSRGASCTKPFKGVFRAHSYIQDGPLVKMLTALSIITKEPHLRCLTAWSKYASALYRKSLQKKQFLIILSEVLNNFDSVLLF